MLKSYMVDYFYLKQIGGARDIKVGYATIKMEAGQEMVVCGIDLKEYGIEHNDISFFPGGTIIFLSRLSELDPEVFDAVTGVLVSYNWDFSLCSDPYCAVVQLHGNKYRPKNKSENG